MKQNLCDLSSEQTILGAILVDPGIFQDVAAVIRPADFYRAGHEAIFRAFRDLHSEGAPIEYSSVFTYLQANHPTEPAAVSPTFLIDLTENVASAANWHYYAKRVRELSDKRKAVDLLHHIADSIKNGGGDIKQMLDEIAELTSGISQDIGSAIFDLAKIKTFNIADKASYLHPIVKESLIIMLYGNRGTGKTMLTFGLLDAITRGVNFGPWQGSQAVNCLFVDGEMVVHSNPTGNP